MSAQPLKKGKTTVNIRPLHDRVIVRRLEEETKRRPLEGKYRRIDD